MENNNLTLSSPWITYANMLTALFKYDDDILVGDVVEIAGKKSINFIGDVDEIAGEKSINYNLDIEVYDHGKFLALWQVLPRIANFGNVNMQISMFDLENVSGDRTDYAKIFKTVFEDNPIFKEIRSKSDDAGTAHKYICFNPEVIQFFNDDISDINGNWSGLAEDIARTVFVYVGPDVHFCTVIEE